MAGVGFPPTISYIEGLPEIGVVVPEKRRAERVRVNLRARYRSETVSLEGRVSDLSRSGLFFRTEFLDHAGTRADVVLEIPSQGRSISLVGEVVWVNESPLTSGMGIRFNALDAGVRRELANLVIERTYHASAEA